METFEKVMEALDSMAEEDRMEVLAELYFAYYHKNIREVMASRIVQQHIREAEARNRKLLQMNRRLLDEQDLLRRNFLRENLPDSGAMVARFYDCLPEDRKKAIRDEIKEEKFYRQMKLELETRKERIRMLEARLDDYLSEVRELKRKQD